jgi:3-oxoacyl-[acyl-carrier-protein] synthase II
LDIAITGIGLQSVLGNLTQSWQNLIEGKSGIQIKQPFPSFPPIPLAMTGNSPLSLGQIVQITVQDALEDAQLVAPLKN